MKKIFTESERVFAEGVAKVNVSNPFLPERVEAEREALGKEFVEEGAEWNLAAPEGGALTDPNVARLISRAEEVVKAAHGRWPKDGKVPKAEARAYGETVAFWLYHLYAPKFDGLIAAAEAGGGAGRVDFYAGFRADAERWLRLPGLDVLEELPVAHLFACSFQLRRAFHQVFRFLVGGTKPMARLRAEIWQSVFTHDMGRHRRLLFSRMGDYATLVTGASGTGKELVARAIGLSRYLAFDGKRCEFEGDFAGMFFPLNLSALSPTLIESELFGHQRGAFTGALSDRAGWMEVCPESGTVFLDEIGDVDAGIQVKLLRVLQARTFQRLGGTETRKFLGKVIAATNQDLPREIRSGRFREDFYYRLCSDVVKTPSLREQLDDAPGELEVLARHVARRLLDEEAGDDFGREASKWILKNLGEEYAWPGNFRELEQCMRNLLLRGAYRPAGVLAAKGEDWALAARREGLTAEELLRRYARAVFEEAGSVEETARRLDLDRRTVKTRLG